jgi:Zn-dependent M16 (insulinase) family peptidase
MAADLRKGHIVHGFEICDLVELAEFGLKDGKPVLGIWARHQKSGAEVFHVLNDDSENLFSFAFATSPDDNTGAAHILEHSVLCGSERYPLKDAFLVLAQGSLQTFLNAWTFPDKTVYPASSVNEYDYFNLMGVYGDAVFRPLLTEWTFMQEGWRLVLPDGHGSSGGGNSRQPGGAGLQVSGVVYNEMKGAYSSLDAYAQLWSVKAVLPHTPYAFESGGDPLAIPGLSWEGLREFHRRRYSPANCRVFLAGNIPCEKQLAFLDERFFSVLEGGKAAPPAARQPRWKQGETITVPCPFGAETKSTVFISWLCGNAADNDETLALGVLTEILLGHDGSPLTRALIESGLGEDLSPVSGLESEIRETLFVAGLRGVGKANSPKQVESLILGELRRLVDEGIPKKEIEAALLGMEFSHKEIRRSGGPFSLVWMRRSLRGWIHGAKPWETLLFNPGFKRLKEKLAADARYFESFIEKYLLCNPHRALVIIEPEEGFLEKQEEKAAAALALQEKRLSETDKLRIKEKAGELARIQAKGDSAGALAAIPHLSRSDLSPEIEKVSRELIDLGGVPGLRHDLFTNGITYVDLAFPLDVLPPGDYPWLPLFSRVVPGLGLPGMDYGEVSGLLARTAGGFHTMLQTGTAAPSAQNAAVRSQAELLGRDWLVWRLKALDEKTAPSLDLALSLITEADFSDERRIRDLLLEMKNEADSSLAPSGHSYASGRSGRFFSRSRGVDEIWNGLYQVEFVHKTAVLDIKEIKAKLVTIRDRLLNAGLIVNLTGAVEALNTASKLVEDRFARFGAPSVRNADAADAAPFFALIDGAGAAAPEVFASPSLQVGFAALTMPAAPFDTDGQTAEIVLAHELSTGALWENIRMKGGAYGAFAQPDSLEGTFSFSSYRDPDPGLSLKAFEGAVQEAAKTAGALEDGRHPEDGCPPEEGLVKAIIGCYARETRPRTGAEKGIADFFRYLYGIDDGFRGRKLRRLIDLSAAGLAAAKWRLASQTGACPVVVAPPAPAEKAAKQLGVNIKTLPV